MFLPMVVTPESLSPASDDSAKKQEARLRKQKYNRDRLRQKRTEYQAEFAALEASVRSLAAQKEDLEAQLKIGILPWADVAAVFKDAHTLSKRQNTALRQQVMAHHALCVAMHQWVSSRVVPVSLNPHHSSWRDCMVPADGEARKLGLDWISKRLYHNLQGQIEASGLPGPAHARPYYRIDVEHLEATYRLTEFKQRIERVPFAVATRTLQDQYFEIFDGDEEERQDADMTYIRYQSYYGRTHNVAYTEKMLVRQFKEENRYIIFTHGVPDDEKYKDPIRCDWSAWVVVLRLSPAHCLLQFGYTAYGLRQDAGYLPLEKEMPALTAFTTDDDEARFERFRRTQRDDRLRRQMEDVAAFQQRCAVTEAAMATEGLAVAHELGWESPDARKERARIKKQDYNRERLRQKRCQHLQERAALTKQLEELTATLQRAHLSHSRLLLPWHDVASALLDERSSSEATNRALKDQVRAHKHLCRAMLTWLSSTETLHAYPESAKRHWTYAALPKDQSARLLGLDWISRRLYHNVEGCLERSQLPPPAIGARPYYQLDVRAQDNSYFMAEYKQFVESAPLEVVAKCLEDHYFETAEGDLVDVQVPNLSYVRYTCLYGLELQRSFPERMLVRQYKEANRYIVFTHGVPDDCKFADDPIKSEWTAWVVAERIDAHTTVIKHGFETYGLQTPQGYLDLDEEVPHLRVLTDEDDKFAQFRQYQRDYRARRSLDEHSRFSQRIAAYSPPQQDS
ncbi:hypothetical protein ACHHYP_15731 [Achlya hypogyna]|uniref:Uncharacterized protein n=1 Tax=Achlya hypogyna TaxID=1202772 RepID=A0A1V9YA77_ACHHY|nr:hypothetical protein ACHHYP_15731 [Achlya hypogyna]